jgi:hypothetical protein
MEIWTRKGIKIAACEIAVLVIFFVVSTSHACDEALNPKPAGDWDHRNSPMQTYQQNCHPAQTICQLPRRGITKKESDLNPRAALGPDLGTPTKPLVPEMDTRFGPEVGKTDSLNQTSVRNGPAIKDC